MLYDTLSSSDCACVCVQAVVCCVQLRYPVVMLIYTVAGLDMSVLVMPCV